MEKIASFTVNHLVLKPGIYVSRKDHFRDTVITTFDLRLTTPNKEPVLNTAEAHTIEHLGATFLRNEPAWKDRVVYFGPMGCRTGFYLLIRNADNERVLEVTKRILSDILAYEGPVFGASRRECGNFRDLDLSKCKAECSAYLKVLEAPQSFRYAE